MWWHMPVASHVSYAYICKLLWNNMYMIHEYYVVFDELICLWYDMLKACLSYVMWLLWHMTSYDMCMMWIVMSEGMKMLWYDICVTWMIYDMIDMQNDELTWYTTPIKHERYDKMIWRKMLAGLTYTIMRMEKC